MTRRQMSYDEKAERQSARWHGARCKVALEHLLFHQKEASLWRACDGTSGTLTTLWQERADRNEADAVSYARKAAHHALVALAAADASHVVASDGTRYVVRLGEREQCDKTLAGFRCQLVAGHDGPHDCLRETRCNCGDLGRGTGTHDVDCATWDEPIDPTDERSVRSGDEP